MKLKKKEDQSVDTSFLLTMGNKISMEGELHATSTPVVTSEKCPENLDAVRVHRNLVSWNHGILYKECSNVLALVGKQICVLSLNIALLQVLLRIDILTYS